MRQTSWISDLDLPDWRYGLGLFAAAMMFVWHPFSGGPRVPTLILFLLGIAFWVMCWKRLASDQVQRRWLLIIACLGIPTLLSLITSHSPEHTAIRLLLVLGMFVVGSAMIEVFRLPSSLELLKRVLSILLVIWIVDALVQMAFGKDLLGVPLMEGSVAPRVVGMNASHLYLQWVLVLSLPVLLWALLPNHPYKSILLLLAAGVVIQGSGVRAAWLSWLIVAGVFFWRLRIPKKWLIVIGLLVSLVITATFSPVAQKKLEALTIEQVNFEQMNKLLNGRLVLWEVGWLMFKDQPLTGIGADAYRQAYGTYSYRENDRYRPGGKIGVTHPHHIYVAIAAETGAIGIIGMLGIWVAIMFWYFRRPKEMRLRAEPYAVGLLAVMFPVNSQPLIYKTWWVPLLVFFAAALLASLEERGRDST